MTRARWAIIAALLGTAVLAGCREDERNRLLSFEPGVYQGKKDTPLSAEALERLRERGRQQIRAQAVGVSALGAAPAAGSAEPASADASPPASAPAADRNRPRGLRLQHQNF